MALSATTTMTAMTSWDSRHVEHPTAFWLMPGVEASQRSVLENWDENAGLSEPLSVQGHAGRTFRRATNPGCNSGCAHAEYAMEGGGSMRVAAQDVLREF